MLLTTTPLSEYWTAFSEKRDDASWSAFIRSLYPIYASIVYRVSSRWGIGDPPNLEDALQEVFLKLTGQRQALLARVPKEPPSAIESYLKILCANATHDYWRNRNTEKRSERRTRVLDENLHASFDPRHIFDHTILFESVNRCLECDENERTIFWLYYRQGLTAREIAAIKHLDLSVKGVESVLARRTAAVRAILTAEKGKQPEKP